MKLYELQLVRHYASEGGGGGGGKLVDATPNTPPQVALGVKVTGLALIINNFETDKQKLKADIILMHKGQRAKRTPSQ